MSLLRRAARMAAVLAALALPLAVCQAQPVAADTSTREAEVIARLRRSMLTIPADRLELAGEAASGRVWAAVMEVGVEGGAASLLTFADGSTSLYFSRGEGGMGACEHGTVQRASAGLVGRGGALRLRPRRWMDRPCASSGPPYPVLRTFLLLEQLAGS